MLGTTRTNTLVRNPINLTIKRLKMSEGKARSLMEEKMTPEQQAAAQKAFAKQEATRIAAYKKNLREGNDLKKLQVEELELNVRYFNAKKLWMAAQPELEEMEAKEQAIMQKERADREKLIKEQQEKAEKKAAEKKPEIVIPKVGKSREE
jgi:hypothetical protein